MRIRNLAPSKLSTRTALLFGSGLFAIAALCLFVARYFFLMNLNDIEREQLLQHNRQAKTIIDILVRDQSTRSFDWSNWDESYQLVTLGDDAYRDRNMYYDGFKALDIDLMVFMNRQGQVMESMMTTDAGLSVDVPDKISKQLLSSRGVGGILEQAVSGQAPVDQSYAGLIAIDDDILVVSISPVRNSLAVGPVGGWLIWCRNLSEIFPSRFSDILLADHTLEMVISEEDIKGIQFPSIKVEGSGKYLASFTVLEDINGYPLAVLKSSRPRTIFHEGNQLISRVAIAMFIAAVVIGLLTLLAFRKKVGSRFLAFEKGLETLTRDQHCTRIKAEGGDEFSMIDEVIKQILAKADHQDSALNDVAEKFDALYRTSNLGLLMVLDGQIVDANDTIATIVRYPSGKVLVGQPLLNLCPESSHQSYQMDALFQAVTEGKRHFEAEMLAADGSLVACKLEVMPIRQQDGDALMLSVKDVSQQKEQEGLIKQLEKYDSVTGLVNRQSLLDSLKHKLAYRQHSSSSTSPALLYLRIERFNIVAGAFGHQMADEVLVAVANELKCQVGTGLLGRVAESEFAFVLTPGSRFAPYRDAKAVIAALEQPILVEGVEVRLSVSVGLVLSSEMTPDAEAMMNAAEYATYCARAKKSRIQLFNRQVKEQLESHIVIQRDISKAITNGDIYPQFQPLVCGDTEAVCGFEALARWRHPELGDVSPAQFIPMAESRELIVELGSSILERSCQFLAKVNHERSERGLEPLSMHVNLSSPHFSHHQLIPLLQTVLERYRINPGNLTIEITESILIGSTPKIIQRMQAIKRIGVQLALDDFGTGYSALSSLCEFPLDIVKLDRSFVKRIGIDEQGEILISNIISMAKALGLRMVAEGVETELQKLALQAFNVEEFQGFYFYRPMIADEAMRVALQGSVTAECSSTATESLVTG